MDVSPETKGQLGVPRLQYIGLVRITINWESQVGLFFVLVAVF